jgi:hypothetical protein
MEQPTSQQIRSWINRQRTRPTPSSTYIRWLRAKFKVVCEAEIRSRKQPISK